MRSDPKVVEHLNTQLTNELTAINQYFLHARTLRHWGVTLLAKKEYEESIEEMRHADWLIERILFLGGLPNVQRLNQVLVGQTVREILEADLKLEEKALVDLREGIAYCEEVRDYVSRDLLLPHPGERGGARGLPRPPVRPHQADRHRALHPAQQRPGAGPGERRRAGEGAEPGAATVHRRRSATPPPPPRTAPDRR